MQGSCSEDHTSSPREITTAMYRLGRCLLRSTGVCAFGWGMREKESAATLVIACGVFA